MRFSSRTAVAPQTKFSVSSKILRNLGSMPKKSKHVLSNLRKLITWSLGQNFGECCGRRVLTVSCYWQSSHCIHVQGFVSVSVA